MIFLNRYLNSPKTWLHYIKPYRKIAYIFVHLIILPYQNIFGMLLIIICLLIAYITLKLPACLLRKNIFTFIFFILLTLMINTYNISAPDIAFSCIDFKIPRPFIVLYNNITRNNSQSFSSLRFPEFILRVGLISIIYLGGINLLYMTTLYEEILLFLFLYLSQIQNPMIQELVFASWIASYCAQMLSVNIYGAYLSMQVRGTRNYHKAHIHIKEKILLYYWCFATFLNLFRRNINDLSIALYSREINIKAICLNNIYHTDF